MIPVLATLLWSGIAAADAVVFAQLMICQPLVSAVVLGWLWGDLPLALSVGAVLQLFAAAALPLGARTPEDYAAGGVVGVGAALWVAQGHPFATSRDAAALIGTAAGLLASLGGIVLQRWQRRRNESLARWCEVEVERGARGALARASWAGVAMTFGVGVCYCAACLSLAGWLGTSLMHRESLRLSHAWSLAHPLWTGFGIGQLLYGFVRRQPFRVLLFSAALIAGWLLRILGVA